MDSLRLALSLDVSPYDDISKAVGKAVVEAVEKRHPELEGIGIQCRSVELDAQDGTGELVISLPMSEHEGLAELADAVDRTGLAAHEGEGR